MKFIRDKVRPVFQKLIYKMFLNDKYSEIIDQKTLDKFINFGVAITNIFLNVGIFFSMYFIIVKLLYASIGFEKTILVTLIIIIVLIRAFLEEFT